MRFILLVCWVSVVLQLVDFTTALAEEAKPATIDMTAALVESDGRVIKDCPPTWDAKADPESKTCPPLTIANAANYGVSFAIETDRQMDWRTKASLRAVLDKYRDDSAAVLTHKQADDLMERIGGLYKLMQNGDKVIVAAMKILQPAEYSKLIKD
jgi:hypothetical protein